MFLFIIIFSFVFAFIITKDAYRQDEEDNPL